MLERVRRRLPPGDGEVAAVAEALDELAPRLRRSLAEGPLHFRRQLNLLVRALQAGCLLADGETAVAALHIRRHLVSGYDPEADTDYAELVDEVVGTDLKSG